MLSIYNKNNMVEAGIDEAGRGSLYGGVYSCAVIWNKELEKSDMIKYVKDSKKLSRKRRKEVYDFLIKNVTYGLGVVNSSTIDKINILEATKLAMKKAVNNLTIKPKLLVIDGCGWENKFDIESVSVVKGDNKYYSIAAASIIAKVSHDIDIINDINNNNSLKNYSLDTNMGYGTKKHIDGIRKYGYTSKHRKSFMIKGL